MAPRPWVALGGKMGGQASRHYERLIAGIMYNYQTTLFLLY
jgi:hypothetical protein